MDVWVERQNDTVIVRAKQEEGFTLKLKRLLQNEHPKAKLIIDVPPHCPIEAKTITGSLEIEVGSAPVSARVITGKLRLQDIQAPIYAKTVTGQLTYTGHHTDEDHRFESATGEIVLTLSEPVNAQLTAQTGTGNLSCGLPLTERREERHLVGGKLRGTLGNGVGRIKAKIGTGSLVIRPLTPTQKEPEALKRKLELV
jgi:hypothetical protein